MPARALPLHEAKQAMRRRILAARDALDPASRERASRIIGERIARLPAFAAARTVLITLPFRSEWDTGPLVKLSLASGRIVAVPRVLREARMLEIRSVRDPAADIVPGHLGIPEPRATCSLVAPSEVDVVIVPGVAFDIAGRRLGYGGGFYDRLLPLLRAGVPRIAGAFEAQIVEAVPAASHDLEVDCLVTEARFVSCAPPGPGETSA